MNETALEKLITPGTSEEVVQLYRDLDAEAREATFGLEEEEIVVLDTETTGFSPERADIIEIAASICKGPEILATFSTFVKPRGPIPEEITNLTGITDEMVADAPRIEFAIEDLYEFIGERNIVAHNAEFDRRFIEYYAGRPLPGTWYDSLVITRIALPRLNSHRLEELAQAFCEEAADHRATSDVAALVHIWRICLVGLSHLAPGTLDAIIAMHPGVNWPEREILAHIAAQSPREHFDLKAIRSAQVAADREPARDDALEVALTFPDPDRVTSEFSREGVVGAMYEGYEPRAEQIEMTAEVLKAFSTATHRAIEAGTGVGKSIAYLLPAALFAQQNKVRTGVATKTNALLDQLVYHELPELSKVLPEPLRYVSLKGYDHYPCLLKIERFAREDRTDSDALGMLAMLYAWTTQSSWGDLDSINLPWFKLPRDQIVATQGECLKSNCKFYPHRCYLHGARRRAESADIVVTNHALLFRDMDSEGAILPPVRHWIVDEAHSAEAEARDQLSLIASHQELGYLLGTLKSKRGGLLSAVGKKAKSLEGGDLLRGALSRLDELIPRATVLTDAFFSFVKDLANLERGSSYDRADIWISEEVRETGAWGSIVAPGRALEDVLTKIVKDLLNLTSAAEQFEGALSEQQAALSGATIRLKSSLIALSTILDGTNGALVYSARVDRRPNIKAEVLAAEKYDIGETLAEDFYPNAQSVIYTSATIATGESFEYFARSIGFDRIDRELWSTLRLPSSYDFENNMSVYAPSDLPAPNEPGYIETIEELLVDVHTALGGSVLTLFTNRREMEMLYKAVKPRLQERGLEVRCQTKSTSAKRLRDEFLNDTYLSLFALRSFWEGFDAPGDTLRCVIIPKLPFGRPTDPLTCERRLRDPQGAWSKYALPDAIIDVKQAAGRLIRSSTDTGALILADSRVRTKRYGRQFLEALPAKRKELETVKEIALDLEANGHRSD